MSGPENVTPPPAATPPPPEAPAPSGQSSTSQATEMVGSAVSAVRERLVAGEQLLLVAAATIVVVVFFLFQFLLDYLVITDIAVVVAALTVLAIWIHTTGILGKLFSEVVEAIDQRPVEGIRATGANKLEEIVYGVIPQVIPLWASYSLYRFESNVRAATVLGIVGAGGIGMPLYESIRSFAYPETCAVLTVIIITVVIIDTVSAQVRKLTL